MKRLLAVVYIAASVAVFATVSTSRLVADTRPDVLKVGVEKPSSAIYIGNSFFYFNNGLAGHVSQLLRAADPKYTFRSSLVTIGGSGMDWHDVNSYFRPNAIGSY